MAVCWWIFYLCVRWNQAVKQTQVHGANMATVSAKADQLKEEYEESCNKMYQARVSEE